MAGNSMESLLVWMKDLSRMSGWDAIVALDGYTLNALLQQEYSVRLSQGVDPRAIKGAIKIPETAITHYIDDFALGAPVLSFEHASLESARSTLSMAVVRGNRIMVEFVGGMNKILQIAAYDPLDGPQLRIELTMPPSEGSVELDPANIDEILLTISPTANEQREGGKFFKAWFEGLNKEDRVYTLGTFPHIDNPFMEVRRVDIRTQANGETSAPDASSAQGAMVLFTTMKNGVTGAFPGNGSDFRYLIPDDVDKAFTATALFSLPLIHRAAFGYAVLHLLDNPEFEYLTNESGATSKMVAVGGALEMVPVDYRGRDYMFEAERFSFPATGGQIPLTVGFETNQAVQHWQADCILSYRYKPLVGNDWKNHRATFNVKLEHEFHLLADEPAESALEGHLFTPYDSTQEVTPIAGLPENLPADELEAINDFVASIIKRAVLERFSTTLTTLMSSTFLAGFDLAGGNTLQPSNVALPFDLAMFGQARPSQASFSIVPQGALMLAGGTLPLSTEPAGKVLTWTVQSLPGSVSAPGVIGPQSGVYEAPPAHAMNNSTFNRVLIVARDKETGEQAATLLTIHAQAITVNPQIQLCGPGDKVELTAGSLSGGTLLWTIKNPVAGESGALAPSDLPDGGHRYTAAAEVAHKTYVLDEIEIHDSATDQTRSAWILVVQSPPGLTIKPLESPSPLPGQVQLQAYVNGASPVFVEWRLPLDGPGSIDQNGLYVSNPLAKEGFVLITAFLANEEFGNFEGHIILPLPLDNFPAVVKALSQWN